ncbi:hypothetical protein V6B33_17830 [Mangrovibacillus sp. Mu-81]|jgi:hypothetical protein|uniref:hypothetical protein n=1 Tax=Mangrovibacillus sp. Mu-81 TaxID=3121478 RepID=UPI002FE4D684
MLKKLAICLLTGGLLMAGCSSETTEKEKQYTLEEAADNGDVIVNEEGKVENLDKLLRFIEDVQESKESQVTLSNFFNLQVSLNELKFDGDVLFYSLKNGEGEETVNTTCGSIEQKSGSISLQECSGESEVIGLVQVSEYQINKAKASMEN